MFKKTLCAVAAILLTVISSQQGRAQADEKKFEVGAQFSTIDLSTGEARVFSTFPCFVPPCPVTETVTGDRTMEPGLGARFGYRLNQYLTLEAETNFFPRDREFDGGSKIQVLAGAKVGKRFDKVGVFAKARPGFVRLSRGDYRFGSGGCVAVFPPPIACMESIPKTSFAFDAGGVVELYPSSNTIIRFDAGDTLIRYDARNVAAVIEPFNGVPPFARVVVIPAAAQTVHNLQMSVGVGFRF
jgi:hypothetical protein